TAVRLLLIGKRNKQRDAIRHTDASRNVPFSGQVFQQKDVSRPNSSVDPSPGLSWSSISSA
ncbi:MAG: hypothetical protein ABIQ52_19590, partial [Vicinamibacterales bacterium]